MILLPCPAVMNAPGQLNVSRTRQNVSSPDSGNIKNKKKIIMKKQEDPSIIKVNTSPHLCKARCKKFMLEYAERRAHKFNRVAGSVYIELDFKLRDIMRHKVDSQPSKGKTIK